MAQAALEWNWNVGSPIVMKFLQKTHILSMTEFIVHTYNKHTESAQLIFNDLLETEFMLLGDLLSHANCNDSIGLTLSDLLNEGFKRLCNDIIENSSLLMQNYLDEVEEYVQGWFTFSCILNDSENSKRFIFCYQMIVLKKFD